MSCSDFWNIGDWARVGECIGRILGFGDGDGDCVRTEMFFVGYRTITKYPAVSLVSRRALSSLTTRDKLLVKEYLLSCERGKTQRTPDKLLVECLSESIQLIHEEIAALDNANKSPVHEAQPPVDAAERWLAYCWVDDTTKLLRAAQSELSSTNAALFIEGLRMMDTKTPSNEFWQSYDAARLEVFQGIAKVISKLDEVAS